MDELADSLAALGNDPIRIWALSSTGGYEFIVFESEHSGEVAGVISACRPVTRSGLSSQERTAIRSGLIESGWRANDQDVLMAPQGTMWLTEELWYGDLDDFTERMRRRRTRIHRNVGSDGDEDGAGVAALSDVNLLVEVLEEVCERAARPVGGVDEGVGVVRPVAHSLVVPSSADQDRAAILETRDGLVLVVADGAGGTGGGEFAADAVIRAVSGALVREQAPDWVEILREADASLLDTGWTTAVVVEVSDHKVRGASVGDSRAWLYRDGRCTVLTEGQQRKPLIGSGNACPVPFSGSWNANDLLFVATDGVCDYLPMSEVGRLTLEGYTLGELLEVIKLPHGGLPDDAAIIRCCLVPS